LDEAEYFSELTLGAAPIKMNKTSGRFRDFMKISAKDIAGLSPVKTDCQAFYCFLAI
jgi:hypothetical protein